MDESNKWFTHIQIQAISMYIFTICTSPCQLFRIFPDEVLHMQLSIAMSCVFMWHYFWQGICESDIMEVDDVTVGLGKGG